MEIIIQYIIIFFLTLVPIFEIRWSIPIGMLKGTLEIPLVGSITAFGLPPLTVFIVAVLSNMFLGIIAYLFFDKLINYFLKYKFINKHYINFEKRTIKKSQKIIEKYGAIGIALFVAIPIPGSGSWTGALISKIFQIDCKKFLLANAIGVTIAGIIITLISMGLLILI
jgi:uncharacterized membrane protein